MGTVTPIPKKSPLRRKPCPRVRRSKNLTSNERQALYSEYIALTSNQDRKHVYGLVQKLCEKYCVEASYPRQLARRVKIRMDQNVDAFADLPRSGRPHKASSRTQTRLGTVARKLRYEFLLEEIALEINNLSPTTVWRELKRNHWREVKKKAKPSLSAKQKARRFQWAKKHQQSNWIDHVDIDEKWFFTTQIGRKIRIPPGVTGGVDRPQHKSHVPKVMFLAAVARPRPRFRFNGKVGLWRIAVPYKAKRKSKFHKFGEVYEKDKTLDATLFRKIMTSKVFPAIRKKMRFATCVSLQCDGAAPHTGKNTINLLNRSGKRSRKGVPTIHVTTQPPQSPDTNVNDLSFFASLTARVKRLQRGSSLWDTEQLVQNVREAWKKFPVPLLDKSFQTKSAIVQSIISHNGDNSFEIPHSNK